MHIQSSTTAQPSRSFHFLLNKIKYVHYGVEAQLQKYVIK